MPRPSGVAPLRALALALLAVQHPEAARPARKSDVGSASLDKFNEQFSHLHVKPSTHRAVHRHDGETPTLVVTFALHAAARSLMFVLPPGYEPVIDPGLPTSCGIFAPSERSNFSVYSRATGAQPATQHIQECEIKPVQKGKKVELILHLCEGVHGLSAPPSMGPAQKTEAISWWFFHLQVWLPDVSPTKEDNIFALHWSEVKGGTWAGSTEMKGDPVFGDWDCKYSDWETWGTCSARCGGGLQTMRRRILVQPPADGSGVPCKEEVNETIPCNTHACVWPCEFAGEIRGKCSAECGGGVRIVHMMWHGEHCPDKEDVYAVRKEACGLDPCKSKCQLQDTWTVVTECSEMCGPGYFWLMRAVEKKDASDSSCQPEWRKLPCLKQRCTPLTVVRPDINIHPYPDDSFKAGVLFKVPVMARVIQLNAPEGFKFGNLGGTCNVFDHDLAPHFESCHVGVRESQAVLKLSTPVPATYPGDYSPDKLHPQSALNATEKAEEFDEKHQFMIDVLNEPCQKQGWVPDMMATTMTCDIPPDQNRWVIEFGEDGTTRWESESTEGYPIFAPYGSEDMPPFGKGRNAERLEAVALATSRSSAQVLGKSDGRPHFCSPRIPCKDGAQCSRNGICL